MTLPAGWADMTPEQRAAKRTERRAARDTRRTARRARVDQAITTGRANADEFRAKLQAALSGSGGDLRALMAELAPLIKTGMEQLKPGGATFDANPFFESFYSKVPAQYQAQVREAVGDLPTRINGIAGQLEQRAVIQPMPPQAVPAGAMAGPMNPPGTSPGGSSQEIAALIQKYMGQMGGPRGTGAGAPGPGTPWPGPMRQPTGTQPVRSPMRGWGR